ncbi:MAG: nucleotidyltransferase family protein [Geobacter sp.]|nr:nucleotidyltransferase family protein [Geobacter sp.]
MEKVDAIILAGGLGTRLRDVVSDVPKPLAPVNGRPFLDILLTMLDRSGCVGKVVLAVGHLGEKVISAYGNRPEFGFPIDFSEERELLGTGGAIRLALQKTESHLILALNGDSFVDVDLQALVKFHEKHGAAMTVVLREVADAGRYGSVVLAADGRIISFAEKVSAGRGGLINAGIYLFRRELFDGVAEHRVVSLENDLFPLFLDQGVYGFVTHGRFIDIGLPETYAAAQSYLKEECE